MGGGGGVRGRWIVPVAAHRAPLFHTDPGCPFGVVALGWCGVQSCWDSVWDKWARGAAVWGIGLQDAGARCRDDGVLGCGVLGLSVGLGVEIMGCGMLGAQCGDGRVLGIGVGMLGCRLLWFSVGLCLGMLAARCWAQCGDAGVQDIWMQVLGTVWGC